ncbi:MULTISPECIES: hypothetical protein [unclassified Luteimonas]
MTSGSPRPDHDDTPLPPDLAADLRALRGEVQPTHDLWPRIAARIAPRADASTSRSTPRPGKGTGTGPGSTIAASAGPARPIAARRDWRRYFRRRNAGYAAAATVVLAVAGTWQLLPVKTAVDPAADPTNVVATAATAAGEAPLLRAADALAREYQGALREVQATTGSSTARASDDHATAATMPDGLDAELERSAVEVRAALARDPDALHLFHRLQRIYAHRLALSLRQA